MIDVTTTEIADEIGGGVLSAGPTRLDAIARSRVPYVGSCGALDMINFWAMETVPAQHRGRNLYRHNANVTLMRTTAEECRRIGQFLVDKLNRLQGPVRFLIPQGGVSMLDAPGQPFWDPAADKALFDVLISGFRTRSTGGWSCCRTTSTTRPSSMPWSTTSTRSPAAGSPASPHGRAMARIARKDILDRFRGMIARGEPIIGGGAGTGLSAKCEEAGGIDLIVIYNSGRYRTAGRGSRWRACWPMATPTTSSWRWRAKCCRWFGTRRYWRGKRHRSIPDPRRFPGPAGRARLLGRAELSDRRHHRWPVPSEPRGDRHGFSPRG